MTTEPTTQAPPPLEPKRMCEEVEQRLIDAEHLLQRAADRFRFYERQHRAKQTPEADAKADANDAAAREIEDFLGHATPLSARTYSVESVTTKQARYAFLEQWGDPVTVIRADPLVREVAGGRAISMGFPALLVSPWVEDHEAIGKRIAELLTGAGL